MVDADEQFQIVIIIIIIMERNKIWWQREECMKQMQEKKIKLEKCVVEKKY